MEKENDKQYFLIRAKTTESLYIHEEMLIGGTYYLLKEADMDSIVLATRKEAKEIIEHIGKESPYMIALELYPINDYIANRKVNPKANHNG